MDRDEQILEASELMLEASARVWAAEWERAECAREILESFGEGVVREAARANSMTHQGWLKWGRFAREVPDSERLPDRSFQWHVKHAPRMPARPVVSPVEASDCRAAP